MERAQLIAGKYELERLLGKGSMGEVWRARHATLDDAYAVKLIDLGTMPDAGARFQMEAHIAAMLSKRTRHVVSVTDHGEQGELAYIVMELLEGESLDERIQKHAPLPLAEISTIVSQVSRALAHAHAEGFVHRDLKPANIFLTKDEDGQLVAKLLDFGIARAVEGRLPRSPFATAKDTIVGTPNYMSPEQARGLDTLDHRCDLWALAVVTYEALSGGHPFEGETLQDIFISIGIGRQTPLRSRREDLPEPIYAFYDRGFAHEIEDRFESADELARAFSDAAGVAGDPRVARAPSLPVAPPPMPPLRASSPSHSSVSTSSAPARESRRLWWLALVLLLSGVIFVAVRALRGATPEALPPPLTVVQPPPVATQVVPSVESPARPSPSTAPSVGTQQSADRRRPLAAPPHNIDASVAAPPPSSAPPAHASSPTPMPSSPPDTPPKVPAPARSIDRGEIF